MLELLEPKTINMAGAALIVLDVHTHPRSRIWTPAESSSSLLVFLPIRLVTDLVSSLFVPYGARIVERIDHLPPKILGFIVILELLGCALHGTAAKSPGPRSRVR